MDLLVTFDVYTALFDVLGSLQPRLAQALPAAADSPGLARAWRRRQMEYALISNSLGRGRVSFNVVTRRALDDVLSRAGPDLPPAERDRLMRAWLELEPWPEAAEVLRAVQERGCRLGLLSNGDLAMLEPLAARLPVRFEHIFASDQAGHYKPHPAMYALPLKAPGVSADRLLHVAGSVTDVMGTRAAGLRCAWSNRSRERVLDPALQADHEFPDLRGLLDIL